MTTEGKRVEYRYVLLEELPVFPRVIETVTTICEIDRIIQYDEIAESKKTTIAIMEIGKDITELDKIRKVIKTMLNRTSIELIIDQSKLSEAKNLANERLEKVSGWIKELTRLNTKIILYQNQKVLEEDFKRVNLSEINNNKWIKKNFVEEEENYSSARSSLDDEEEEDVCDEKDILIFKGRLQLKQQQEEEKSILDALQKSLQPYPTQLTLTEFNKFLFPLEEYLNYSNKKKIRYSNEAQLIIIKNLFKGISAVEVFKPIQMALEAMGKVVTAKRVLEMINQLEWIKEKKKNGFSIFLNFELVDIKAESVLKYLNKKKELFYNLPINKQTLEYFEHGLLNGIKENFKFFHTRMEMALEELKERKGDIQFLPIYQVETLFGKIDNLIRLERVQQKSNKPFIPYKNGIRVNNLEENVEVNSIIVGKEDEEVIKEGKKVPVCWKKGKMEDGKMRDYFEKNGFCLFCRGDLKHLRENCQSPYFNKSLHLVRRYIENNENFLNDESDNFLTLPADRNDSLIINNIPLITPLPVLNVIEPSFNFRSIPVSLGGGDLVPSAINSQALHCCNTTTGLAKSAFVAGEQIQINPPLEGKKIFKNNFQNKIESKNLIITNTANITPSIQILNSLSVIPDKILSSSGYLVKTNFLKKIANEINVLPNLNNNNNKHSARSLTLNNLSSSSNDRCLPFSGCVVKFNTSPNTASVVIGPSNGNEGTASGQVIRSFGGEFLNIPHPEGNNDFQLVKNKKKFVEVKIEKAKSANSLNFFDSLRNEDEVELKEPSRNLINSTHKKTSEGQTNSVSSLNRNASTTLIGSDDSMGASEAHVPGEEQQLKKPLHEGKNSFKINKINNESYNSTNTANDLIFIKAPIKIKNSPFPRHEDWKLNEKIFDQIVEIYGEPDIDLFASSVNRQVFNFVSEKEEDLNFNGCLGVDSFKMDWKNDEKLYWSNPPWSLIPKLLEKVKREKVNKILVVIPWDLMKEKEKELLVTLSVESPIQIIHSTNTFFPPNIQRSKFQQNPGNFENLPGNEVTGVGKPTWKETYLFYLSGKPKEEINLIDQDNKIWSSKKFDFLGKFNNRELLFNLDSGSSGNVISQECVDLLNLTPLTSNYQPIISFANNTKIKTDKMVKIKVDIGGCKEEMEFQVLPKLNKLIIIGIPYFLNKEVIINWKKGLISFQLINSKQNYKLKTFDNEINEVNSLLNNDHEDEYLYRIYPFGSKFKEDLKIELNLIEEKEESLDKDVMKELKPEIQKLVLKYNKIFGPPPTFEEIPIRTQIDQQIKINNELPFPKHQPLRKINDDNLIVLKEWIKEKENLGVIEPSKASFASNLLFVKEKDKVRIVVDYRAINAITIPNKTPLINFNNLKDRMANKKFFSVLDIKNAFYNVRLEELSKPLTAFQTPQGLYQFKVMPMGLINSPSVWTMLMNSLFVGLEKYCTFYMDDLILYSDSYEDHLNHLEIIFKICFKENLRFQLKKIKLDKKEVKFCGFIVGEEGLKIEENQRKIILDYPSNFKNIKDIRSFLGSINFFREFIENLGDLTEPLINLTRKNVKFEWSIECNNNFRILQYNLFNSTSLSYYNPLNKIIIHTDASNYGIGGSFGQEDENNVFKIISYYSKQLSSTERNYTVSDKEFLAIITLIKKFEVYLEGKEFLIKTDHRSLINLPQQPELNQRQVRWMLYLSRFNFKIEYLEGKFNNFADWLSRRENFKNFFCHKCQNEIEDIEELDLGINNINNNNNNSNNEIENEKMFPYLDHLNINNLLISTNPLEKSFKKQLKIGQENDKFCKFLNNLKENEKNLDQKNLKFLKNFDKSDTLWIRKSNNINQIIVPQKGNFILKVIEFYHDNLISGHFGIYKTKNLIKKTFWWNNMEKDIKRFIRSCDNCGRTNSPNYNLNPLMTSLQIPDKRFQFIGLDFKQMTVDKNTSNDFILGIHCLLTKYSVFIPCKKTIKSTEVAKLLLNEWILKGCGIPEVIVSDRDSKFTSKVWNDLMELMGIKLMMSTSRHQRSNGGTEILFKSLKNFFIKINDYEDDNWEENLPKFQFSYNNSINFSTNFTPYYLAFNIQPITIPIFDLAIIPKKDLKNSFVNHLKDLEMAHKNINKSNNLNAKEYNKKTSKREIKVGDMVFLKSDGIVLKYNKKLSRKFLSTFIGPFKVLEKDEKLLNFKLDLPLTMKIHPYFHQGLIKVRENPLEFFPDRKVEIPVLPEIDEEGIENWEVEKILDAEKRSNKWFFLIKWKGKEKIENSWEPFEFLDGCKRLRTNYMKLKDLV